VVCFTAAAQNPLLLGRGLVARHAEHFFLLESKHQAREASMRIKGNWRADSWPVTFTPQVAKKPNKYGIRQTSENLSWKPRDGGRLTVVRSLTLAAKARTEFRPDRSERRLQARST
jgi:hypothetical protein